MLLYDTCFHLAAYLFYFDCKAGGGEGGEGVAYKLYSQCNGKGFNPLVGRRILFSCPFLFKLRIKCMVMLLVFQLEVSASKVCLVFFSHNLTVNIFSFYS